MSAKVSQQDRVCPKGCYVYAIYVDGVLRYIGKGTNGRMHAHMKEVRQRLTRKFKLKNVSPVFQQKLTEAVIKGAVVEEIVIADNLTSKQAYELEHRRMEEMVHAGKRRQLWNVVPPSIYARRVRSVCSQTCRKFEGQKSFGTISCSHAAGPAREPQGCTQRKGGLAN